MRASEEIDDMLDCKFVCPGLNCRVLSIPYLSNVCIFWRMFDRITHMLSFTGIVRELLAMWPGLCKVCNSSNTSPLYSAAVKGHLDVVNAILDADVSSIRIVRKNGKTALHTTARYGLLHIVKALIERDPDIISIKDKKGQTALHMAVKGQDTFVVEEMLDTDSSILNERDKKGNTALHIATRKCRPQVSFYLFSKGYSIILAILNNRRSASFSRS